MLLEKVTISSSCDLLYNLTDFRVLPNHSDIGIAIWYRGKFVGNDGWQRGWMMILATGKFGKMNE